MKITLLFMAKQLAKMVILFDADYAPETVSVLAELWFEAFRDESAEDVAAAMALYSRRGTRFPVPAKIFELLPQCRKVSAAPAGTVALPEAVDAPRADWGKKVRDVRAALAGDEKAKAELFAVTHRGSGRVMQ